jgi:hypothetical protein
MQGELVRFACDFDCVAAMVTLPFLFVAKLMISWPNAAAALPFPIQEFQKLSQAAKYRGRRFVVFLRSS